MTIETEFNLDDTVYFIYKDRICEGVIDTIRTSTFREYTGKAITATEYIVRAPNHKASGKTLQLAKVFASVGEVRSSLEWNHEWSCYDD